MYGWSYCLYFEGFNSVIIFKYVIYFFLQIEVRDDEEQQIKYQQIISTLVAAGYFRARIIGLSPFDMV